MRNMPALSSANCLSKESLVHSIQKSPSHSERKDKSNFYNVDICHTLHLFGVLGQADFSHWDCMWDCPRQASRHGNQQGKHLRLKTGGLWSASPCHQARLYHTQSFWPSTPGSGRAVLERAKSCLLPFTSDVCAFLLFFFFFFFPILPSWLGIMRGGNVQATWVTAALTGFLFSLLSWYLRKPRARPCYT